VKRRDKIDGIRKNKRKESLRKRRAIKTNNLFADGDGVSTGSAAAASAADRPEYAPQLSNLPAMVKGCRSTDVATVHAACKGVRRLLSRPEDPPVQAVIDAGLMPRLVDLLGWHAHPRVMFESAWALTNVGSTEFTPAVVEPGTAKTFITTHTPTLTHTHMARAHAQLCLFDVALLPFFFL